MHMAVLGLPSSSPAPYGLSLLVASILSFLHCGLCKGYVVGRTFLCYGGSRQMLSPWSPYGHRDVEQRRELVRAEVPSQRILFGAWVIQPLLWQSNTPHARAPFRKV